MTKKKLYITYTFILLIWSFSFAQQYTNYTTKDGLPSNHVYKITQDAKGFIWFGTDKGLVKYNGKEMKNFTTRNGLATNDVWGIHPTPDGKVWYLSKSSKLGFVENDSVFSFDSDNGSQIFSPNFTSQVGNKIILNNSRSSHQLINGQWKNILSNNMYSKTAKSYIEHSKIAALETTSGSDSIRIVYKNGAKVNVENVRNILNTIHYRGQVTDSLYYWTTDTEYSILNLNTAKIHRRYFKDEIGLDKTQYTRLNIVNNEIQITGRGFVGILNSKYHLTKTVLIPEKYDVHFALIDKNETVWASTFAKGVFKFPKVKRNIKYYFQNEKILTTNVINDEIIASIYNKGFYRYNKNKREFEPFIKDKEYVYSSNYIDSLETAYFFSKSKIRSVKNGKMKLIDFSNSTFKTINIARQLVYFNQSLYARNYRGLSLVNLEKLKVEKLYDQIGINDMIVHNANFFIATTNGLKEFKNEIISSVLFNNKTFEKSILSIDEISNTQLLLNTDGFGSYVTNSSDIYQLPKSEFLIVNNGYVNNNIIWLATNNGLLKYSKHKNNYEFEKKITVANGLPSNNVNDVIVNGSDLIVSTNNAIAILPKNQESISLFLTIYIDEAVFNGKNIYGSKNTFEYVKNNNTTFSVSSINFEENNKELTYQYKLNPVQNNWISTTSKNINFTNLSPNNYILEFKANGVLQNFNFKITPLWYQKLYSKILIGLFITSVISFILLKIRNREITKKTNKLNSQKQLAEYELYALRSQMNPHFVFNSLNSIQYYINKNEIELSEKYLVKFSRLIRKFFDFSRNKFISIEQEISLLKNYLEIEKMRFGEEFKFSFNIDENLKLKDQNIPSMLLQPIVENSVNHGLFHNEGKGIITINFNHISAKEYAVEIIDDGIGLTKAKEIKDNSIKTHSSKSTEIIADRIKLLNQTNEWTVTYKIKDLNNVGETGTCAKLTFKNNE